MRRGGRVGRAADPPPPLAAPRRPPGRGARPPRGLSPRARAHGPRHTPAQRSLPGQAERLDRPPPPAARCRQLGGPADGVEPLQGARREGGSSLDRWRWRTGQLPPSPPFKLASLCAVRSYGLARQVRAKHISGPEKWLGAISGDLLHIGDRLTAAGSMAGVALASLAL